MFLCRHLKEVSFTVNMANAEHYGKTMTRSIFNVATNANLECYID